MCYAQNTSLDRDGNNASCITSIGMEVAPEGIKNVNHSTKSLNRAREPARLKNIQHSKKSISKLREPCQEQKGNIIDLTCDEALKIHIDASKLALKRAGATRFKCSNDNNRSGGGTMLCSG